MSLMHAEAAQVPAVVARQLRKVTETV